MSIDYSYEYFPKDKDRYFGKIVFETNSEEMLTLADEMIKVIADAMAWRNRVERIRIIDRGEFDDE